MGRGQEKDVQGQAFRTSALLAPAVPAVPELQQLVRLLPGEPSAVLRRVLALVCEQLRMPVAFVAVGAPDGTREVRVAVAGDGTDVPEDLRQGLDGGWCDEVARRDGLLLRDAADGADAAGASVDRTVGSCAGAPLRRPDGSLLGVLCAVGHEPHPTLNERDLVVLRGLAEVAAPLVERLDAPVLPSPRKSLPSPRQSPDLVGIAGALSGACGVEELSRPLLDALHELTGLASSYLTVIDDSAGLQEIRYARNTRAGFALPEGLLVPWEDTLCKRALDEGRACTTDVPGIWGDSGAAQDLGIQVYVSVPVELSDGRVWGTLCAADSEQAPHVAEHLPTMRLFARLIASEVEREARVLAERARAEVARREADTDALTGCASRRAAERWLARPVLPGEVLLVVYADVDAFKAVNDTHGHAAGDAVLCAVAAWLRRSTRPDDLVARLGGDEFLVAARLPQASAAGFAERVAAGRQLVVPWERAALQVGVSLGSVVSLGEDTAALLAAADAAMYRAKASGRATRGA